MKKKLLVSIIILSIIAILLGSIIGIKRIIKSYKLDQKTTGEIVSKINNEYSDFESKISNYNKDLTELIEILNTSSYYQKIYKNQEKIINLLDRVTKEVKELSSYNTLKENCNLRFADGKASRACKSFSQTYEKSVNIYVDVVIAYNDMISKVNELDVSKEKIQTYEGYFKNYIDYNSDGKFLGKGIKAGEE